MLYAYLCLLRCVDLHEPTEVHGCLSFRVSALIQCSIPMSCCLLLLRLLRGICLNHHLRLFMSIVRLENVSLAYGLKPLLKDVTFAIEPGEKICLLGRNGEGKSSLMSLLTQVVEPDSGALVFDKSTKLGFLPQSLPAADERSVFDVVAEGLDDLGSLLSEYHHLSHQLDDAADESVLGRMQTLQERIEQRDGWTFQNKIAHMLKRFGLDEEAQMKSLSGGWRRRVLLAKSLINEPDILLLDEPTNHLDINTIKWLEQRLNEFQGAVLFVSHDRAFIKALASSIVELDRGVLSPFQGGYEDYLSQKQKLLEEEERQNKLFDKRLSEEEVWIRQGIKARRTRNEGRVRALKALREERRQRIDKQGTSTLTIGEAEKSGKKVIEATGVNHQYVDGRPLISDFSIRIMRGDRVGLIGANGAGKTTLLRILLGKLEPQSGEVTLGSKLEVAYFDQLRDGLDLDKAVFDNVADGHEYVTIGGKPRHVISYLNDFLFTAERARTPVSALSGGETNRLLLAKLFAKPSNLIVMDEPTNDLDVDTLELLEDKLAAYGGTLLLTSHDRDFLDQVVSSTLVFEGNGRVTEYVGGYYDWVRQTGGILADESTFAAEQAGADLHSVPADSAPQAAKAQTPTAQNDASSKAVRKKLSYKLKLELESLPAKIEALEAEITELQTKIAEPDFFNGSHEEVSAVTERLAVVESELAQLMDRWVELEEEAEG